ncbi:MAG TPA: DUF1360 domain-containing protein [Chloroflexota bacterium]|nr:DUF1360 domain-containing protein [Chloroflexota bacterium]
MSDAIDRLDSLSLGHSHQERPLGSYALLVGSFSFSIGAFLLLMNRVGKALPPSLNWWDLLLIGTATQRAARLISRDAATSFIRAPFTELVGPGLVQGEVTEKPRGKGLRRVIGELLTSPYSVSQWVAAVFICGLVAVPRVTRFLAAILTTSAISDLLRRRLDTGQS